MNLQKFCQQSDLFNQKEFDKLKLLAFYNHKITAKSEFSKIDIREWFSVLSLTTPNIARLYKKINSSREFIKGKQSGTFKLHALEIDKLQTNFPGLHMKSEEIISEDTILPHSLYEKTRGFIESLAKQINASFEYNIHDGCAVLMRRLLEILLILSYENLNIEKDIQNQQQNYIALGKIIANAKSHKKLNLSKDTKQTLDEFRELGNFSAHKIYYNCRKSELKKIIRSYRVTVEELFYKSGIKN